MEEEGRVRGAGKMMVKGVEEGDGGEEEERNGG